MGFDVRGQHVVVAGGGRSGMAAAEAVVARGGRVTLSDLRHNARFDALRAGGVTVEVGPHRPALFAGADLVVLSPGVSPDQDAVLAARRAGVPVIGEIELASRWLRGRLIAITGTKGKSTTTTLAARMLREAGIDAIAGGNLGTPLSSQVATSHPGALHVVEVSSFQLETTDTFHPWIAVLLNLSVDHLDRHGTFDRYAAAKARIFRNQTPEDWAVINADDPAALALARGGRARRLDFAIDAPIDHGVGLEAGAIVRRAGGTSTVLMPRSVVRLPGRHLLGDVLAAAAVGCVAGVPPAAMQRAVEQFEGLPHALQRVGVVEGVTFVNDSKATNIEAARRSFESFDTGVVGIMGGRTKGGDFRDLADVVRGRASALVVIGEAADAIERALGDVVPVVRAATMDEAVAMAFARAPRPGVVLLAPACASFDMFTDYAERGRRFREAALRQGQRADGKGHREGER